MSDIAAEKFGDLDYPGRRKPMNRTAAMNAADDDRPAWAGRPIEYTVHGEVKEFYTISHLAQALGYSVQSIRAWEDKGLLPRSPFRSPRTKKPVAGGRSNKGKRLWTREQIEGIVRLARRHKVILNKRPPSPAFARDVKIFFDQLTSANNTSN